MSRLTRAISSICIAWSLFCAWWTYWYKLNSFPEIADHQENTKQIYPILREWKSDIYAILIAWVDEASYLWDISQLNRTLQSSKGVPPENITILVNKPWDWAKFESKLLDILESVKWNIWMEDQLIFAYAGRWLPHPSHWDWMLDIKNGYWSHVDVLQLNKYMKNILWDKLFILSSNKSNSFSLLSQWIEWHTNVSILNSWLWNIKTTYLTTSAMSATSKILEENPHISIHDFENNLAEETSVLPFIWSPPAIYWKNCIRTDRSKQLIINID